MTADPPTKAEPGEWLCLEGIELLCTIGVTERERHSKQRIVVNLQLGVDFRDVGASDAIADTVDYRSVARRVIELAEKSSFQLVEALATHLSRAILAEFPKVRQARVEVWKPGALTAAKAVGATIVTARR
jgi:dihydroneopterin aldolase